jgi:ATP-dependent DNA helicase RecG
MVSLVPDDSLRRLRSRFGEAVDALEPDEVQALVTAELEGVVSNSRMQQGSTQHPADLTKLLQGLVAKGLLRQEGQKRGAAYRLGEGAPGEGQQLTLVGVDSPHKLRDSQQSGGDSQQSTGDSQQSGGDSQQSLDELPRDEPERLRGIASPSAPGSHLPHAETQRIILELCTGRYLTTPILAKLMNRHPEGLRNRFLTPMVRAGLLQYRSQGEPNRPDQAYTTTQR